jgi:hypothetical protein
MSEDFNFSTIQIEVRPMQWVHTLPEERILKQRGPRGTHKPYFHDIHRQIYYFANITYYFIFLLRTTYYVGLNTEFVCIKFVGNNLKILYNTHSCGLTKVFHTNEHLQFSLSTKFQIPCSKSLFFPLSNRKLKVSFSVAMLLFYILQKCYLNKTSIRFKNSMPALHHFT